MIKQTNSLVLKSDDDESDEEPQTDFGNIAGF